MGNRDRDENPLIAEASQVAWILVVIFQGDRYILGAIPFRRHCVGGPNNRAVDLGILLSPRRIQNPLPNTTLAPAHVAIMNHPKVAKAFGQIA